MIAHTHHAAVHHCVLDGEGEHVLDIGGDFDVDIAGNYYGGGAPRVGNARGTVTGADAFSPDPFDDVGPRP
jgi:hypothetical protein